jgi:hypothetical protein
VSRVLSRRVVAVLALLVMAAAIAWVSVPFKDRSVNCGVALGLRAVTVPNVTSSTGGTHTLCRGQARERVAVSSGAIVVSVVALVLSRRRWGDPLL